MAGLATMSAMRGYSGGSQRFNMDVDDLQVGWWWRFMPLLVRCCARALHAPLPARYVLAPLCEHSAHMSSSGEAQQISPLTWRSPGRIPPGIACICRRVEPPLQALTPATQALAERTPSATGSQLTSASSIPNMNDFPTARRLGGGDARRESFRSVGFRVHAFSGRCGGGSRHIPTVLYGHRTQTCSPALVSATLVHEGGLMVASPALPRARRLLLRI